MASKDDQESWASKGVIWALGGVERCLEDSCGLLVLLPAALDTVRRVLPIFLGLRTKSRPTLASRGRSHILRRPPSLPPIPYSRERGMGWEDVGVVQLLSCV